MNRTKTEADSTLRVAIAVHIYGPWDQCIQQVIIIAFLHTRCSQLLLKVLLYIQRVLGVLKATNLSTDTPTVFDVLLLLRFIIQVFPKLNKKHLQLRLPYLVVNIIGLVPSNVIRAWYQLAGQVSDVSLSILLSPYMPYNSSTEMYEKLLRMDGFALVNQQTDFRLSCLTGCLRANCGSAIETAVIRHGPCS